MKYNDDGILIPHIIMEKCISCNQCKKICPVLNNSETDYKKPYKAYASWSSNPEERASSASGGLATELYKAFIKNNDAVVGAKLGSNFEVIMDITTNYKSIKEFKGSKYVHAIPNDVYSKVKDYLKEDKKILFIGTPCQIAAIKNVIKKQKNLYTVDIVCHGTPSGKFLQEHLQKKCKKCKETVDFLTFRDKRGFNLSLYSKGKLLKYFSEYKDLYFYGFKSGYTFRENCYQCLYAQENRIGDLTIGDFWGLGRKIEFKHSLLGGISLALVNNEKGEELLNMVSEQMFMEERTVEEAIKGNEQLQHPFRREKTVDQFIELYRAKGFEIAAELCWGIEVKKCYLKHKIERVGRIPAYLKRHLLHL